MANNKKEISPLTEGIQTGLKVWLFFLLSFYWLGYDARFSIGIGAIGGIAGGLIVYWWYITDEPSPDTPSTSQKKTLAQVAQERDAQKQNVLKTKVITKRRSSSSLQKLLGKRRR